MKQIDADAAHLAVVELWKVDIWGNLAEYLFLHPHRPHRRQHQHRVNCESGSDVYSSVMQCATHH